MSFRKSKAETVDISSCCNLRKQIESNRNYGNYGQHVWNQMKSRLACSVYTVREDDQSACNDTQAPSTDNIHKFQLHKT